MSGDETIAGNIVANPVKALTSSGYFVFDARNMYFGFSPEIWAELSDSDKAALRSVRFVSSSLKNTIHPNNALSLGSVTHARQMFSADAQLQYVNDKG